jgi:hypothetical protein
MTRAVFFFEITQIVFERRNQELKILNQAKEPLTVIELKDRLNKLRKEKGDEEATISQVYYDVQNDERISSNPNLRKNLRPKLTTTRVKGRRNKELKLLNQAKKSITIREFTEILRKEGYPEIVDSTVRQDISADPRLSSHRNLKIMEKKDPSDKEKKEIEARKHLLFGDKEFQFGCFLEARQEYEKVLQIMPSGDIVRKAKEGIEKCREMIGDFNGC